MRTLHAVLFYIATM